MKKLLTLLLVVSLSGCASLIDAPIPEDAKPVDSLSRPLEFREIGSPLSGPVVVAVYGFTDKTGQRKPSDKLANISFAVTQGAESMLIEALKTVGEGKWFKVVERVGLDNLTKERQIIRQARDSIGDKNQLQPMLFAGVIIEGAIVGYDSNILTGGAGARWLGVGPYTQYRQDVVTVTLRAVSVNTGEVLMSSTITKTIVSSNYNVTYFKFFDMGTNAAEAEVGYSVNEPVNFAVRSAIEKGVLELIKQGDEKKFWTITKK